MKPQIEFIENIPSGILQFEHIKKWLIEVVQNEGLIVGTITYVFMSDKELLTYNKQYLSHDYFTDVITFDDSEHPQINGDILISIDRIIDNSQTMQTNLNEEKLRVLVHGVLHLCGYKDKTELEEKEMRSKEEFYLNKVDFAL